MVKSGSGYLKVVIFSVALIATLLKTHGVIAQLGAGDNLLTLETRGISKDSSEIKEIIQLALEIKSDKPDSAFQLLNIAVDHARRSDYDAGVVRALIEIGKIHLDQGAYDSSLNDFGEALFTSSKSVEGRKQMAAVLDVISTLHQIQGNYEEAAERLYQAAYLEEKFNSSPARLSYIYNNLGALLFRIGQSDKAIHYLDLAVKTGKSIEDPKLEAGALLNKAIIASERKEWAKGDSLFMQTMELATLHRIGEVIHNTYYNMGMASLQQKQPEQALTHFTQALNYSEHTNSYYRNAVTIALGETWYQLGNYQNAKSNLLSALDTSLKSKLKNDQLDIHRLLSQVFEAMGDCKKALYYHKKYKEVADSIANQEIRKNIGHLDIKYQTALKDAELMRKQIQISKQNNDLRKKNIWIGSSLAGAILLSALSVSLYRNSRRKKYLHQRQIEILQQKQEILKQQQEIDRLTAGVAGEEKERSRIGKELHDGIGGMLTAINMNLAAIRERHQNLDELEELDLIAQMVRETANEIRKTAHNLMPDILNHYSLPEALQLYSEQLKTGTFNIELQHYGSLDSLDNNLALAIYRMLQELIQNVVKHANASQLEIQIRRHEEKISITVEDNGKGFDTNSVQGGFGLKNLQSRIQALNGYVSIESAPNKGTTVYIEINIADSPSA